MNHDESEQADGLENKKLRVDAAHEMGEHEPAASAPEVDATAADGAVDADSPLDFGNEQGDASNQVQTQASQLATHLRTRQRDLDRRESQLNARIAELEAQLRSSRLWFQERETQFEEREAEVQEKIAELEQRAAEVGAANSRSLDEERTRQQFLERTENTLVEQIDLVAAERGQVAAEREDLRQEFEEEKKSLRDREERAKADLEKQKSQLDERAKSLDNRNAALDQLEADIARRHREALEYRLVIEHMWNELGEKASAAELTKSLSAARRSLVSDYRLEGEKLTQQRDEIQQLGVRLDERRHQLQQEREKLEAWVTRCRMDVEEQAARLVAREQELDRQECQFQESEAGWAEERRRYEREIRELRRADLLAA